MSFGSAFGSYGAGPDPDSWEGSGELMPSLSLSGSATLCYCVAVLSVLLIRNGFFLIRILLFSRFRIRIRILHEFFSNILKINFTFVPVLLLCKCVMLLISMSYKLLGEYIFDKKNLFI